MPARTTPTKFIQRSEVAPLAPPSSTIPEAEREAPAEPQENGEKPTSQEERRAIADLAFEEESADPSWSTTAARALQDGFASTNLPGKVVSVECRTTLCRAEIEFRSADEGKEYTSAFARSDQWDGAGMLIPGEPGADGTVAVALYLAKGGAPLPTRSH